MSLRRILLSVLFCLVLFLSFVFFTLSVISPVKSLSPLSKGDQGGLKTPTQKSITVLRNTVTPQPTPTPIVISPTPTPLLPPILYTVVAGDTLEKIAKQFSASWIDIANYNQITDPNQIFPGQIIKISQNKEDYQNINPYYQEEIEKFEDNTKYILVVLGEQRLYTYEGQNKTGSYLISSGVADHPTVTGQFKVWIKLNSTTMSGGTGADSYYLPNVLYTMYFYGDYGIHGTYWHNNFGTPMSHGCLNMSEPDAEIVFNWAEVGTIVQVIN